MRYAHFAPTHASRSILRATGTRRGRQTGDSERRRADHQNFRSCNFGRINARDGGRTRTPLAGLRILSPVRLPVPPPRRAVDFNYLGESSTAKIPGILSCAYKTGAKDLDAVRAGQHAFVIRSGALTRVTQNSRNRSNVVAYRNPHPSTLLRAFS